MLIIGATSTGLFKRFTIGSVASALLHASTVPVALAPHGYHRQEALTRISCGLGTRAGAEKLLEFALGMAANRDVPLRVVSLLALDGDAADSADAAREYAEKCLADALAAGGPAVPGDAKADVPGEAKTEAQVEAKTEIVVAHGRSIEEAVDRPGLGRRRGPVDRIQPACQGPLHLPRQHSEPHPARPAGADDRGPQRLRTQAPQPFSVE